MKLAIDVGNTLIKIGVFEQQQLLSMQSYERFTTDKLRESFKNFSPLTSAIISSVVDHPNELVDFLRSEMQVIELNANLPVPLTIRYSTPDTLGNDRIALAVGASGLYPSADLLIIDAGTCITFDFVNDKGEYFGGAISPGIHMRYKALHTFTDKLPFVSDVENVDLIGNSTIGSIKSGVLNGVIAEVDGIIDRYKKEHPGLKVIFTGGNLKYFDKSLKNNIFANSNLLLEGLNMILDYNVEDKLS